jgi:transmembrane sensor
METSRQKLTYLFHGYYNKTATKKEQDELFAIITAGAHDEELSKLIRQAWDDSKPEEDPLFDSGKTKVMLSNILGANTTDTFKKIATAATLLFFLSFGLYRHFRPGPIAHKPVTKVIPKSHDVLPGGNKAVLTLANGQTIILDNAKKGTLAKLGTTLVNKTSDGQLVYNAKDKGDANTMPSINTIATPRGGQYLVVLPDGTKVWLNAASSMRFPTRFTGSAREVAITGEAYFEVTRNPAMPFKVKTNRAEIEVLGTHFNVMAYDDEKVMKTTLLEGAVNIKNANSNSTLKPNEQAQVTVAGQTKIVNDIDTDDEVAWKNGIFQFKDAGIAAILRQASRWYDVDVVYKGAIPDNEFTGSVSRNVKASELLNMLRYTGVNVRIENGTIIVN